jgi:hypothetical protein
MQVLFAHEAFITCEQMLCENTESRASGNNYAYRSPDSIGPP